MMILLGFVSVASCLPLSMAIVNLMVYRRPQARRTASSGVSVLVPARNEEKEIAGCIEAVLASTDVTLEMLILDDQSTDRTAQIIDEYAEQDDRVRRLSSVALPKGWNGKQHACWQLARQAQYPHLGNLPPRCKSIHKLDTYKFSFNSFKKPICCLSLLQPGNKQKYVR